jgi:hypothetical protein
MDRRTGIPLFLMILLTTIACDKLKPISKIDCTLDSGTFWHDVHLTNNSGKDLHEVNVILTLIGEKGEPRSEKRYYVQWPDGETVKVSLSAENSPLNVQKISLAGSCTEGKIDSAWRNPPPSRSKPAATDVPIP